MFFFCKSFSCFFKEELTSFIKFISSVTRIDWAYISCSAWAIKSAATKFGSAVLSATN